MAEFSTEQVQGSASRMLEADVFRPAGKGNGVAVILLHGGGWAQGHRSMMHGYAEALAALGFVAIAAEYRLVLEAPFPAQVEDIRDTIRWVRANADNLGIDPAKIVLQGYSAGAHLALLAAGTQPGSGNETKLGGNATGSEVAAVVSFFAPARLDNDAGAVSRPPLSLLLGGGDLEAAKAASPIYYVNPASPTTFILGGMADFMQPLASGQQLLAAFVDAGVEVEFHYLHSQSHEFSGMPGMLADVMAEVAFFYRRTLIDREALDAEAKERNIFAKASSMEEFVNLMSGG